MKLHRPPQAKGDTCWPPEYAEQMLSAVAQVDASASSWFLATHSPVVASDQLGAVREHDLFRDLFAAPKLETLVVVKGHPGTGKSQLINWLKLRFDDAVAAGDHPGGNGLRVRTVLIRRRAGSLKDALQQLVEQLPEYERYLSKIQAAISGVSGENAKRRLYAEMQIALFESRENAIARVKALDEVFNDSGAVQWLCRPGGAIHQNVKRLTQESDALEREALPPFSSADFDFPPTVRLGFDEDLRDRLADDPVLREQAANRANEHLRLAIAGLTGLRGHTLNEIFHDIREEMRRKGESLALFVEDVSTLSVLDEELVNALQPLNNPALCPLISVLGMTVPAYGRLPDNLKERVDRVVTIDASSSLDLDSHGGEASDQFVARYLNALRAGPGQVGQLAEDARRAGDHRQSACDDCQLKAECFKTFGFVRLLQTDVGLYPLTNGAARRLLDGLNLSQSARTPRGLLQHVVRNLLKHKASGLNGATVGIPVEPQPPDDYTAYQDRLTAAWSAEERGRLSYLLYYWSGESTISRGASRLDPMLPWFGQRPFPRGLVGSEAPVTGPALDPRRDPKPAPKPAPSDHPKPAGSPLKVRELRARLESWFHEAKPLQGDSEFRTLLHNVVSNSVELEQVRAPSNRIQELSLPLKSSNIVIEGMTTRAAAVSKARFAFGRTQEVYELLSDLVAFEHLGRKSWNYDGGIDARRRYATWLASRADEIVRGYEILTYNRDAALGAAIRFLRLAYRFAARKDLPSDLGTAVETIVGFSPATPSALSSEGERLAQDLVRRFDEVRGLVIAELAVRQGGGGGGGGIVYIDPVPLIKHLGVDSTDFSLGELPDSGLPVDYPVIAQLKSSRWASIVDVLEAERAALADMLTSLHPIFIRWRVTAEPLATAAREFLESARAVVKACEEAQESLGNPDLQKKISNLAPAVVARHVKVIESASAAVESGVGAILGINVDEPRAVVAFIAQTDEVLMRLLLSLEQQLATVVTAQDVEAHRQEAANSLEVLLDYSAENDAAVRGVA